MHLIQLFFFFQRHPTPIAEAADAHTTINWLPFQMDQQRYLNIDVTFSMKQRDPGAPHIKLWKSIYDCLYRFECDRINSYLNGSIACHNWNFRRFFDKTQQSKWKKPHQYQYDSEKYTLRFLLDLIVFNLQSNFLSSLQTYLLNIYVISKQRSFSEVGIFQVMNVELANISKADASAEYVVFPNRFQQIHERLPDHESIKAFHR